MDLNIPNYFRKHKKNMGTYCEHIISIDLNILKIQNFEIVGLDNIHNHEKCVLLFGGSKQSSISIVLNENKKTGWLDLDESFNS